MQHKTRGKGKKNSGYTNINLYSYYLKGIKPVEDITGKKIRGEYQLKNTKEYTSIVSDINNSIIDLIIKDNFEFKMPYNLGKKRIIKKKRVYKFDEQGELITKFLPINWKETNALWLRDEESKINKTLVYHTNIHSNGYKFGFHWGKFGARTNNITVIAFKATRTHSRELAENIFKGNTNYFE